MIVLLSYQLMEILHADDSQNQMMNELLENLKGAD